MVPSVNSPKYSLIDVEKDEINGKLYEKKLVWSKTMLIMIKVGNNEFYSIFDFNSIKGLFPENTWAGFRFFCKEEVALDGDWRVAIFPTSLNNVTDEEFTYFRATEVVNPLLAIAIDFSDLFWQKKTFIKSE